MQRCTAIFVASFFWFLFLVKKEKPLGVTASQLHDKNEALFCCLCETQYIIKIPEIHSAANQIAQKFATWKKCKQLAEDAS